MSDSAAQSIAVMQGTHNPFSPVRLWVGRIIRGITMSMIDHLKSGKMTNRELQAVLARFPPDAIVRANHNTIYIYAKLEDGNSAIYTINDTPIAMPPYDESEP